MKIELQDIAACVKRLAFEVPADVVTSELERAYAALSRKVKIKGFRPGKAPRRILEQYYRGNVENDVLGRLISEAYGKAIEEKQLRVVGEPKVEDVHLHDNEPLTFTATVETMPEVALGEYQGLSFTRTITEVRDEDIERQIEALRERHAELDSVTDRGVESSDYVTMDFALSLGGEPVEDGAETDYSVLLGRGNLLPDFESQLLGAQAGESRQFKLNFPDDYTNANLAGKEVDCSIQLKEIKKPILPERNDEFAQSLGEYATFDEMRAKLREELVAASRSQADRDLRRKIMEALIEQNTFEAPQALIDRQTAFMISEYQRHLQASGLSAEQAQLDFAAMRESLQPEARYRVKMSLLLQAAAEQHDLQVEDEEIDADLRTVVERTGQHLGALKSTMREQGSYDGFVAQLLENKAYDAILSSLTITDEMKSSETANDPEGKDSQ